MYNTIDRFLEKSLRRGAIPFCCTGASICFALYSFKVASAAQAWMQLEFDDSISKSQPNECYRHGIVLQRHAGTCAALSAISFSISVEAFKDWRAYRSLVSLEEMERVIWNQNRKLPFLVRIPVLTTSVASFCMAKYVCGGLLFSTPYKPAIIISKNQNKEFVAG